jgi:hypothetical protein
MTRSEPNDDRRRRAAAIRGRKPPPGDPRLTEADKKTRKVDPKSMEKRRLRKEKER